MSPEIKTSATKEEAKSMLVPRLRFPEFRGVEGWVPESMSKLYSFKRSNSLSRDKLNYVAGSVKNIHYGDIHTKFSAHFDITQEFVPFINESEGGIIIEENMCAEGDIIFADASEDLADIGKCIEIVRLNEECVVSGLHTILARPMAERIVLGFGGHLFKSRWVRSQIQKEAQGAKVLGISPTRLRNLRLPLPNDKAEQQKIADCLSSLDELIAAQARKVEALKTHRKGLMQQIFPREGETQPRLRFPEFQETGEWGVETIGDIFETSAGGTPERSKPDYWNGLIPWITTSLVDFNVINRAEEFITQKGLDNSSAKIFPINTVLIALIGQGKTRGKVALLNIEASTNQNCAGILPAEAVLPIFAFMNLCGRYEEIRSLSNTAGQGSLSQGLIRTLPFLFPKDKTEQQRIADCLSSLDAKITAETHKLETLKTHKKALMQQLFPAQEEMAA